jgi:hypothetical protein
MLQVLHSQIFVPLDRSGSPAGDQVVPAAVRGRRRGEPGRVMAVGQAEEWLDPGTGRRPSADRPALSYASRRGHAQPAGPGAVGVPAAA